MDPAGRVADDALRPVPPTAPNTSGPSPRVARRSLDCVLSTSPRVARPRSVSRPPSQAGMRLPPLSVDDSGNPSATSASSQSATQGAVESPPPPAVVTRVAPPVAGAGWSPTPRSSVSPGPSAFRVGHIGMVQALRSGALNTDPAALGWTRPAMVVAPPQGPPPRDASRRRPTAHRNVAPRRAADRGCVGLGSSGSRSLTSNCTTDIIVSELGASVAFESVGRSPSMPASRARPLIRETDAASSSSSAQNRAVSVDTAVVDDAARAKARAVAALQKLFFEEVAKGKDASGAAAAALLRLSEQTASGGSADAPGCDDRAADSVAEVATVDIGEAEDRDHRDDDDGNDSASSGPEDALEEPYSAIQRNGHPSPVVPMRPSPLIGEPTRRRPNNLLRYRVAVNN